MKDVLVIALVFALMFVLGYASPVPAQNRIKLSGPHYTLNIIGVEKGKNPAMTNSDRHTIFVGLGNKSTATTNIYLQPGDFTVCDGNGFDAAYDCNGAQIKNYNGATFQLPRDVAQTYYVYARALGKPDGLAKMMTCATDPTGQTFCASDPENVLELTRSKGQSQWKNVTSDLTLLVADINNDGVVETIALFADENLDFFWQYDNDGLKHAQIRLYPAN